MLSPIGVNTNSSTSEHSGLCLVVGLLVSLSVLVTMYSIWLIRPVLIASTMSLLSVSPPSSVYRRRIGVLCTVSHDFIFSPQSLASLHCREQG